MIGQNFSLNYLIPLAIEQLRREPLVAGDFFPGDLLAVVLMVDSGFWRVQPQLRRAVQEIVVQITPFPKRLYHALLAFQHP